MKSFSILAKLLKFDSESSRVLRILFESRFPNKHIQFIVKAKPYWTSMRIELEGLKGSLYENVLTNFDSDTIRIKFLLQRNNVNKLNEILRPMYLITGKTRTMHLVDIGDIFRANYFNMHYPEYIQYNYYWHF